MFVSGIWKTVIPTALWRREKLRGDTSQCTAIQTKAWLDGGPPKTDSKLFPIFPKQAKLLSLNGAEVIRKIIHGRMVEPGRSNMQKSASESEEQKCPSNLTLLSSQQTGFIRAWQVRFPLIGKLMNGAPSYHSMMARPIGLLPCALPLHLGASAEVHQRGHAFPPNLSVKQHGTLYLQWRAVRLRSRDVGKLSC